jgi:hypothetical protein
MLHGQFFRDRGGAMRRTRTGNARRTVEHYYLSRTLDRSNATDTVRPSTSLRSHSRHDRCFDISSTGTYVRPYLVYCTRILDVI